MVPRRPNKWAMALLLAGCVAPAATALRAQTAPAARTGYPGGRWEPGPARYRVVMQNDVAVTMDDGVVLRANIAYPADLKTGQRVPGKFPVVLEHTPYIFPRGDQGAPVPFFAQHGYISVVVRARGTGASGGEVNMYGGRDRQDGRQIIEWAAHSLLGSDGRVAMFGCSYPGGLALGAAAAAGKNSPLKAVIVACNGFEGVLRQAWQFGGVPTTGFTNYPSFAPGVQGNTPQVKRFYRDITAEIMAGGDAAYEGKFWSDRLMMSLAQDISDNRVPLLLWTGWRDMLGNSVIRAFTALQNAEAKRPLFAPMPKGVAPSPRYQIVVGNWRHAQAQDLGVYLQWIETWLKGVDTGIGKTATPMHLFEGGTRRWINLPGYPVVNRYTDWNLGPSGTLATDASRDGQDTLRFSDPQQAGGKLSFTSAVLDAGATLAGPISATVFAKSSNRNLEIIARLFDLAPDGTTTLVSKGAVLGSQRQLDPAKTWTDRNGVPTWPWQTLTRDDYLVPGRPYQFDLTLGSAQWGVQAGHRLRLELTTQSPRDICPETGIPKNNGDDPCRLTMPQQKTLPGGIYTILYGPKWRSAVHLPQLRAGAFPSVAEGTEPTALTGRNRDVGLGDQTLPLQW